MYIIDLKLVFPSKPKWQKLLQSEASSSTLSLVPIKHHKNIAIWHLSGSLKCERPAQLVHREWKGLSGTAGDAFTRLRSGVMTAEWKEVVSLHCKLELCLTSRVPVTYLEIGRMVYCPLWNYNSLPFKKKKKKKLIKYILSDVTLIQTESRIILLLFL